MTLLVCLTLYWLFAAGFLFGQMEAATGTRNRDERAVVSLIFGGLALPVLLGRHAATALPIILANSKTDDQP
jgi:hypothetical protein